MQVCRRKRGGGGSPRCARLCYFCVLLAKIKAFFRFAPRIYGQIVVSIELLHEPIKFSSEFPPPTTTRFQDELLVSTVEAPMALLRRLCRQEMGEI